MYPLLVLPLLLGAPEPSSFGLRLPAGFEVMQVADDTLAADIHCMTLTPDGRVVVAGRGYIRLLVDDNGDGRADRALDFRDAPRDGAMGLLWEGNSLYCVGDGGLRVYRDASGAGRSRPSEVLFRCKTGGEHTAHAVVRGPDGWLYLLAGDGTGIDKRQATLSTSPIRNPVGGCILRFTPDFKHSEIVADGFRNAYGMDFNSDGELFTYDSDNERCVSLPWYEFTRCYHVHTGGQHGWQARQHTVTWRMPPYFLDIVAPITTLGRGSPTGVVCYKHAQFPQRYRGGLFLLDWTFGQIHFVRLERQGSTYRGTPEVFLRATGDNGFAPTAAAVHPDTGDLYIAIGGRGTRGAVYRVRHVAGLRKLDRREVKKWQFRPRSLDWRAGLEKEILRDVASSDFHVRRRALELAIRHQSRLTTRQIDTIILSCAGVADRGIRQLTARLLSRLDTRDQQRWSKLLLSPLQRTTLYLARPSLDAIDLVSDAKLPVATRLDGIRLVQHALGDIADPAVKGTVWEGYTRRNASVTVPDRVRKQLRAAFPSGDDNLDREVARTLAMIEDDDTNVLKRVADRLTADSHPIEDFHYLIVLARLRGKRSAMLTRRVAGALLALGRKLDARKLHRESNWPLRIAETHAKLAARDADLNRSLVEHPEFGRPGHVVFCRCKGFDRRRAAEVFLARANREDDYAWNGELVTLVGELSASRSLPVLRRLWGEQGLDEMILPILARHAQPGDRERLLAGLTSPRLGPVAVALSAIEKLPVPPSASEARRDEALALARSLRQLSSGKEEDRLRSRLLARIGQHTAGKLPSTAAALAWFRKQYPSLAPRISDADGVDVAGWKKRLAGIAWDTGDSTRGQAIYIKTSCATCHSGVQALGPDLRGVTGRFSRDDLFTAILQPSKDVSPRYRTTQLTTSRGQVYQGLIVYEAADSVILLTGPGQTARLAHTQISEKRLTTVSLMPTGLLDRLKDEEIADLYAYLKSLGGK